MQHGVRYVFRASRSRRFSGDISPGRIGTTTDDTSGADVALDAHLGWTLYRVLDGLRFPVPRRRVLAQADAWGSAASSVSG